MGGNLTMNQCKFYDCTVNGRPLATYGGASLLDFSIGETSVKPAVFQGVNRSSWNLLENMYGQRDILLTVVFDAPDLRTAKLNRSALNSTLFEVAELYIPEDGFHYRVICKSTGSEELVGVGDKNAKIKSQYQFTGIRHDDLKTITLTSGATLYCLSTMPFTDCRLTATVGTTASSYTLGGAVFSTVSAGDVLVFDGIDGKITKNGSNYAASVSWVDFPQLVPGENLITCADTITVQYYPTYI
jgi:phage-related protein